MIEKIEILQHGEGRDLSSHSCEETSRFLCVVAYHHELVIELRKDRLDSLSETLVGPCGRCPVLLVQSVRDIKGDVGRLEQVQLYGCAQVPFVSEDCAVVVFPLHILQILQVVHIGCRHIIGMDYSADTAQGMKLVAVIVHVLRGAVAPGWCMLYVILTHLAPVGTGVLTNLYRFRIYAEYIFASIYRLGYGLTDILSKHHGFLATLVVLPTRNQVGNSTWAFRIQPLEKIIFTVNTQCLCRDGKCHYLQIGECGYNTASRYISLLIYLISCKFLAYLKNFSELCDVISCLDTTKLLKINDMCNFLSINVLQI